MPLADDLEVAKKAAAMVFKPEAVEIWLVLSNPMLDGKTPIGLIGDGELNRVLDLIDALAEGAVF